MSEKRQKMVSGFNHNVKHKGRIYHVQTEDSGVQNPHIITHLFVGGNILATKKTSYADIVKADNLEQIVKELMQEQHKAMLRNLVNGVYDDVEIGEPAAAAPMPPPAASATPPAAAPSKAAPPPLAAQISSAPPPATGKFPVPKVRPPRTEISIPRHELPTQPVLPAVSPASASSPGPVAIDSLPLPPARPQVVLRAPPVQSPPKPAAAKPLPPEVMAARELAEKPRQQKVPGPTIFGEDLISEKSLDEVILSYLAGEEPGEG